MSRGSNPQPTGDHQRHEDTGTSGAAVGTVTGNALPVVGEKPPAHWLFWSYLWRCALLVPLPFIFMGMLIGYMDSTGNASHTDPEMIAHIATFGAVAGGLSQTVAFIVAMTLFVTATPARRRWAAHRDAGWTTRRCLISYSRHRNEAAALKLNARLRELGLAPIQPQAAPTPPPRKKPSKMDRFWASLAIPLFVAAAFVFAGPWLDTKDVQTFECEVVSAEPRTSSAGIRGSVSTASVLVKTSNCGQLAINRGVSFDNREEVASTIKIGANYEFDIGWYSRTFFKNEIQSVRKYRLIASEEDFDDGETVEEARLGTR